MSGNLVLVIGQETETAPPPGIGPNTTQSSEKQPAGPAGEPGAPARPQGGMEWMLPMMMVFLVLMIFMSWRSSKRERQKTEQMLSTLKKNDKVQTIGGIIGTVVDVRDQEIVLKVDESTNTRIQFNKAAIKGVIASKEA